MQKKTVNLYLVNPSNLDFIKKKRSKPVVQGIFSRAFGLSMLVFMLGLAVVMGFILREAQSVYATLEEERAEITGVVVNKSITTWPDSADDHNLRFEYTVEGATYNESRVVNEAFYDQYAIGNSIPVIYSPQDPSISVLQWEPNLLRYLHLIPLIIIPILLLIMLLQINGIVRVLRLQNRGKAVRGVITDVTVEEDEGDWVVFVRYRFTSPLSQKEIRGRSTKYVPSSRHAPKTGAPCAILYLRDGNYQLL